MFRLLVSNAILRRQQQYGRVNVGAQGSPATAGVTHIPRLADPLPKREEHDTPDQPSSQGSLPVLWFCQPALPLVLHVLPLVAMYSSTSAAR
jgi:hypothetical protein